MLKRFAQLPSLTTPGLFVTGTDTGVGKTLITCGIAFALRARGQRIGVCKPFATGCAQEREGLVNDDTLALAHFSDCRLPLNVINPIRYAPPLAPAVAAEQAQRKVKRPDDHHVPWGDLAHALHRLDTNPNQPPHDSLLIEGAGGVAVPLDPRDASITMLDLAKAIAYPVVLVTRPNLGTLNHTALSAWALQQAGLTVAGMVINGHDPEDPDPSIPSNPAWMQRMTGLPVLCIVPRDKTGSTDPADARIGANIMQAIATVDWAGLMQRPTQA